MKTTIRTFTALLALFLLSLTLIACQSADEKAAELVIGRWRTVSFTTDDGVEAPVGDHELDMIFYTTMLGEAQIDGKTLYFFEYSFEDGKMHRTITYTQTNVTNVVEDYEFSEDGRTLTVYSPADEATIVLEKIEDRVLDRVEIPQ